MQVWRNIQWRTIVLATFMCILYYKQTHNLIKNESISTLYGTHITLYVLIQQE